MMMGTGPPRTILSYIFQEITESDISALRYPEHVSRGVTVIRKMAPVGLIVYRPKTEEGQMELAKRVSDAHAAAVTQRIRSLDCPTSQKLELLAAVIETAKERRREQT